MARKYVFFFLLMPSLKSIVKSEGQIICIMSNNDPFCFLLMKIISFAIDEEFEYFESSSCSINFMWLNYTVSILGMIGNCGIFIFIFYVIRAYTFKKCSILNKYINYRQITKDIWKLYNTLKENLLKSGILVLILI